MAKTELPPPPEGFSEVDDTLPPPPEGFSEVTEPYVAGRFDTPETHGDWRDTVKPIKWQGVDTVQRPQDNAIWNPKLSKWQFANPQGVPLGLAPDVPEKTAGQAVVDMGSGLMRGVASVADPLVGRPVLWAGKKLGFDTGSEELRLAEAEATRRKMAEEGGAGEKLNQIIGSVAPQIALTEIALPVRAAAAGATGVFSRLSALGRDIPVRTGVMQEAIRQAPATIAMTPGSLEDKTSTAFGSLLLAPILKGGSVLATKITQAGINKAKALLGEAPNMATGKAVKAVLDFVSGQTGKMTPEGVALAKAEGETGVELSRKTFEAGAAPAPKEIIAAKQAMQDFASTLRAPNKVAELERLQLEQDVKALDELAGGALDGNTVVELVGDFKYLDTGESAALIKKLSDTVNKVKNGVIPERDVARSLTSALREASSFLESKGIPKDKITLGKMKEMLRNPDIYATKEATDQIATYYRSLSPNVRHEEIASMWDDVIKASTDPSTGQFLPGQVSKSMTKVYGPLEKAFKSDPVVMNAYSSLKNIMQALARENPKYASEAGAQILGAMEHVGYTGKVLSMLGNVWKDPIYKTPAGKRFLLAARSTDPRTPAFKTLMDNFLPRLAAYRTVEALHAPDEVPQTTTEAKEPQ